MLFLCCIQGWCGPGSRDGLGNLAFKNALSWAGHQYRVLGFARPCHRESSAANIDKTGGIKPVSTNAADNRCACSSTASKCFAAAALKYTQSDVLAVDDLHKTHIYSIGELSMVFDHRADMTDRGRVDVFDFQHGVWIAHGNCINEPLTAVIKR